MLCIVWNITTTQNRQNLRLKFEVQKFIEKFIALGSAKLSSKFLPLNCYMNNTQL